MLKNMMKKSFLLIVGFLLVVTIAGCSKQVSRPTPEPGTPVVSGNNIYILNFAFDPQTLTVKAGTKVIWNNNDSATHTVKSTLFESPLLSSGQTFEYTFNQAGTYDYSCSIHPSMKGQIIVQP